MKFTVFVPTRGSWDRVKYVIAKFKEAELYFITSHMPPGSISPIPPNVHFVPGDSLPAKRNLAVRMAKELGLEYCLQLDDDLGGDLESTSRELVENLFKFPYLGATTALNDSDVKTGKVTTSISHPWIAMPKGSAFVSIRIKAFYETEGYVLPVMEDIDLGAQLCDKGWLTGGFRNLTYSHLRGRGNKLPGQGGLPLENFSQALPECIERLKNRRSILKATITPNPKMNRQRIYWDWKFIWASVESRWGELNYVEK